MATSQATAVDIGELLDKQKLSAFHLGTRLYVVAGPYLVVMMLNFMLGRIFGRQFRTPAVATAGE